MSDPADPLGLDALAAALLDPATSPHEQQLACEALYARCLARIPALEGKASVLASGKALSPADAASCVLDSVRTTRFLRAVDAAIKTKLERAPGAAVEVLYAGCGPIAPLALLLARRFHGRAVRFTLVDIHPSALACARRLFEFAGGLDTLRGTLCADAATLCLPDGYRPDVLVAEVMQRALAHEPQLAVVANLVPQCASDMVLVPARITVSAHLARLAYDPQPDAAPVAIGLATLLELSKDTLPVLAAELSTGCKTLPERCVQVPQDAPTRLTLMLHTRIETAPGLMLNDSESGLTTPQPQLALGGIAPGEWLAFAYRLDSDPGFFVRRVPEPGSLSRVDSASPQD